MDKNFSIDCYTVGELKEILKNISNDTKVFNKYTVGELKEILKNISNGTKVFNKYMDCLTVDYFWIGDKRKDRLIFY